MATSLARAFVRDFGGEFSVALAGPESRLADLGVSSWGPCDIVPWNDARYSALAPGWSRARYAVGAATWYFPHWDAPWFGLPAQFVMTLHDVAHLRLPDIGVAKRLVAKAWMRRTLGRASRVLVVSEFSARETANEWPAIAHKLRVVPNGVDASFFTAAAPLPPTILQKLGGQRYMLSVGIRKRHKNLRIGVDVLRQMTDLRWIVVGDSFPEWTELAKEASEAGVLDRMIVLDRESDAVLHSLYANSELLFFPSRYEGFGLPVLEALASGTPVVASNIPSVAEILGTVGWRSSPDDASGFVRSIREVRSLGAKRAEVVAQGQARARLFTWERAAAALAESFREIALPR